MPKLNKKFLLIIFLVLVVITVVVLVIVGNKKVVPVTTPTPFPTATPILSIEEQQRAQTLFDIQFAQESKATVDKYPFITKLPITTSKYKIVFDFQLEKIRVRLNGVIQQEVQSEIESVLKGIGVNTTKYPVVYLPQ